MVYDDEAAGLELELVIESMGDSVTKKVETTYIATTEKIDTAWELQTIQVRCNNYEDNEQGYHHYRK